MLKKSTLICMRLFSAFVSAIISVGFLASMCCCNCGSAYADEAGVSSGSSVNSEKIDGAENKQNCNDAVVPNDAESEDSSYRIAKCRVNKGHTDAFATYISKKGKFVLGTRGDSFPGVNENHIRYNPTLLVFVLGSNTKQSSEGLKFLPKNGSNVPIWGLSQTQDTSKLWPGFATETLGEKSGITGVRFAIKSATVPKGGAVYAYQDDAHGDVTPVIGTPNTKFPHKMYVGPKAHMHVNWIFTKAGKYVLDVEAAGRNEAGSIYKNVQKYTFEVDMDAAASNENESIAASEEEFNDYSGFVKLEKQKSEEDSDGEESEGENGEGDSGSDSDSDGEESEGENGSDDGDGDDDEDSSTSIVINGNNNRVYVTPWPGAKPSGGLANRGSEDEEEAETESSKNNLDSKQSKSKNKNKKTTKKCSTFNDIKEDKLIIKHGHVDLATYSTGNGIGFAVQEDVTGSHVKRDPSKVVFYAGNAAKDGNVWRLPQTQKGSVPWVGWSNQGLHPHKSSKISLESVKGPGSVRIWLQGGLGTKAKTVMSSNGNRTYMIPANTHMHLNWDFSKSGYYTIRLAVSANGKTLAKDFHFAIGVDALKTPMGCSVSEVGDGEVDGDSDGVADGDGDGDEDSSNGGNSGGNSESNSGSNNNGGSTPLAAASYSGDGGSSFFGGGFASNKSKSGKSKSAKTGRTVKVLGTIGSKSRKGVEAKYASKRVKGLRRSLLSNVKDGEPTGISGLFSRNPVLAYSLIIGGVLTVLSVTAAGIWFLYKRGLISLNWLLRY